MANEAIITVLDIGASKVCCLMGAPGKSGAVDVYGYGVCYHNYYKEGVVVDIKGLSETINRAISDAEESSGIKAQSVFFNLSGTHIKGVSSHGELIISDKDNEITRRDADKVIANAKAIHMPYERDIIYSVNRGFSVDGEKNITNPVGMFGIKIEADLYLVTAKISVIDNLKKAVRQSGIGIEEAVLSCLASAKSVITDHDKELGVILIDIGADLTEIAVFTEGRLSHVSYLPIGGDNITRAISEKLRIPEGPAERLKIEHASLENKTDEEKVVVSIDSRQKTISIADLNKAAFAEYNKIFESVKKDLESCKHVKDASSGVVICGEPAIMDGSLELAEMILNFPVRMAHASGIGACPKNLPSHIYASAIGLLRYAVESRRSRRSILTMGPKNMVLAVADRARQLYEEYF